MVEILVWMLLTTSDGNYNRGNVNSVAMFKTEVQCEHVKKNIPLPGNLEAKCVQANILVQK